MPTGAFSRLIQKSVGFGGSGRRKFGDVMSRCRLFRSSWFTISASDQRTEQPHSSQNETSLGREAATSDTTAVAPSTVVLAALGWPGCGEAPFGLLRVLLAYSDSPAASRELAQTGSLFACLMQSSRFLLPFGCALLHFLSRVPRFPLGIPVPKRNTWPSSVAPVAPMVKNVKVPVLSPTAVGVKVIRKVHQTFGQSLVCAKSPVMMYGGTTNPVTHLS